MTNIWSLADGHADRDTYIKDAAGPGQSSATCKCPKANAPVCLLPSFANHNETQGEGWSCPHCTASEAGSTDRGIEHLEPQSSATGHHAPHTAEHTQGHHGGHTQQPHSGQSAHTHGVPPGDHGDSANGGAPAAAQGTPRVTMLVCSECGQEWEWFPFSSKERAPTPPVRRGSMDGRTASQAQRSLKTAGQ